MLVNYYYDWLYHCVYFQNSGCQYFSCVELLLLGLKQIFKSDVIYIPALSDRKKKIHCINK